MKLSLDGSACGGNIRSLSENQFNGRFVHFHDGLTKSLSMSNRKIEIRNTTEITTFARGEENC